MKAISIGILASVALGGGAMAQGGGLPTWNGQDAYSIMKNLEPQSMTDCKDRHCTARDGGLGDSFAAGAFSTNVDWSQNDADNDIRLDYKFLNCAADQTGCKSLEISAFYFKGQSPPDKMARWNAANPACVAKPVNAGFNLTRTVALTSATTKAQLDAARAELRACKARYDKF